METGKRDGNFDGKRENLTTNQKRSLHTARTILSEGKAAPIVMDWARAIVRANPPTKSSQIDGVDIDAIHRKERAA